MADNKQSNAWYIKDDAGMKGPFSELEVRRLFSSNKIPQSATIRQGASAWRSAVDVQVLFDELDESGWYVLDSLQKTTGPFTARRLVELIEGRNAPGELKVKKGKIGNWQDPRTAIDLIKVELTSASNPTPEQTDSKAVDNPSILRNLATQIGQQAHLKSIEMLDLPKAHLMLGLRAFETQTGRESQETIFSQIEEIDSEIVALRSPIDKLPNETLGDKTTRLAQEAKRRIEIESLQKKRRSQLIALGSRIAENPKLDNESVLSGEIEKIRKLKAQTESLQSKVSQGRANSVSFFRTGKRWLVGVGLLLTFVFIGYWWLRPKTADERLQSAIAESRRDLQEAEEDRMEQVEQRKQQSTERAATEVERLQRAIKEMRKRNENSKEPSEVNGENDVIVAKLEKDLKLLEAKEKQKRSDDSKRQELAKQRIATREALESAQVNRMALCDDLFGKIELSLDKSIQLSDFLLESGAILGLRGPNLNKILSHLAEKDWLAIVNLLLEKNYPELPDGREIATAADRLKKYEFQVLLRTESQLVRDSVAKPEFGRLLAALSVTSSTKYDVLELEEKHSWNHHPDGIGFTQVWSPNQGSTIVTLVSQSEFNAKRVEFRQSFVQRLAYLNEKSRLGEIESDLLPDLRRATVQTTKDSIAAWALTRSIDLDEKGGSSFDPGNKLFALPKRGRYLHVSKDPKTNEEKKGEVIVFCEDIVAWGGHGSNDIGALYVRDRSHPVEKEGLYVFRGETTGLFVVRAHGENTYHATVLWGDFANYQTLQDLVDSATATRELSGKWQSDDCRITGVYNDDANLKKQWKAILAKNAPFCLKPLPVKRK